MISNPNIDGRLTLVAEVRKIKWLKQLKYILTNLPDISVCNTNLPRGLNGKSEKRKRIVTNKGLEFKMRYNDWLFRTKLQVRDVYLACLVTSIYTKRM